MSRIESPKRTRDHALMHVASDVAIDALVAKIHTVQRVRTIEVAYEIGQALMATLYGGDREAYRDRGDRDPSYRKLLAHPKLALSTTTLWRALGVFDLLEQMPGLRKTGHLRVTHFYSVLTLPPEVQARLLRAAEQEQWTAEKLEEQAIRHRLGKAKRGRPPAPALARTLRDLRRIASREQFGAVAAFPPGSIGPQAADELRGLLGVVRARCADLEAWLEGNCGGA